MNLFDIFVWANHMQRMHTNYESRGSDLSTIAHKIMRDKDRKESTRKTMNDKDRIIKLIERSKEIVTEIAKLNDEEANIQQEINKFFERFDNYTSKRSVE